LVNIPFCEEAAHNIFLRSNLQGVMHIALKRLQPLNKRQATFLAGNRPAAKGQSNPAQSDNNNQREDCLHFHVSP
jgi:hypothetical protein